MLLLNSSPKDTESHIVEKTHRLITATCASFFQRSWRSLAVFVAAVLAMIASSSLVALMSRELFVYVLDDEILATTIAIGMHLSLAIAVHIYVSGLLDHRPLNRKAGLLFVEITILGLIWVAIMRAVLRINNGHETFPSIAYTIIYFVVECIVPAIGGYVAALAHYEHLRRRSQYHVVAEIKHKVLQDNHRPHEIWASALNQLDGDIADLNTSIESSSGDEFERLKNLLVEKEYLKKRLIASHPSIDNAEASAKYGFHSEAEAATVGVRSEDTFDYDKQILSSNQNKAEPNR